MIVEEREYARLLGYPWGTLLEGDVRERAEQAAKWYRHNGRPLVYCVTLTTGIRGLKPPDYQNGIDANWNPTVMVARGLQPPDPLVEGTVTAITAGREADEEVARLWDAGRVDEAYFLDRYAAAVVEKMAADLGAYQSPGTGNMPFELQWELFSHIKPLNPEMEMLSSGMLNPKNSLLAFVPFDAKTTLNPCTRCDLRGCTFRRTTS